MDQKERVALIRKGNELFNEGKIEQATKIFEKTKYRDGLTRVGDLLFYDRKKPLYAYKYYKLAGRKDKINEIFERMVFALNKLIKEDEPEKKEPESTFKLPPLKVSPKLKIFAEEILRDNEKNKGK